MRHITRLRRMKQFFDRYQIHPLFGLRLVTYPLTALATYLNFWLISSEYGNSLFNLFLIAWMLIGTVQILEYALGVQIMNSVAINGYRRSILREVWKNITYLGLALSFIYTVLTFTFLSDSLRRYLTRFPSSFSYDPHVLILVFIVILFLSGSYQLISRILLGLKMNASTQIAGLIGYLLSSVMLCTYVQFSVRPDYWVAFAIGLSPIALSLIPAIYLVYRINPISEIGMAKDSKQFTGFQYGFIYLGVSTLSTFNAFFPRIMTKLTSVELTRYLLTFTVIGIFMNIGSSLSQLLWVENLKSFPSKEAALNRYRRAVLGSLYSLPPFVLISLALYKIYAKLEINEQAWILIGLAFLFFVLQSIHLISSSLIISKKDLIFASSFLIVNNIILILFSRTVNFELAASSYLLLLIISSILSNYLPTLILAGRRVTSNEV